MISSMPTWDGFLVFVLRYLQDNEIHSLTDIRRSVANLANLTDEQQAEQLPSGQLRAGNRIGWAVSLLNRVGAIERPTRAHYRIARKGTELLERQRTAITEGDLRAIALPGDDWGTKSQSVSGHSAEISAVTVELLDPHEQIEDGLNRINAAVAAELLKRLQSTEPAFFEAAVVKLLVAMGYGGAEGRAAVTQQSHDSGIDGVIDRDALGLDRIYIQAKRYASESSVLRPEVQAFVGALSGKASSGVFLTTGRFSSGAIDYARTAHTRVILIDGRRLTDLMIRFGIGVQNQRTLHVVAVDEDFFE